MGKQSKKAGGKTDKKTDAPAAVDPEDEEPLDDSIKGFVKRRVPAFFRIIGTMMLLNYMSGGYSGERFARLVNATRGIF